MMLTTADSMHTNVSTILSVYRSTHALISNHRTKISTSIILTTVTSPHSSIDDSISENTNISRDDIYSPMSGIKTAATLSGMLILVIIVILWKSRSRNCRFSFFPTIQQKNQTRNYPRLSATSFDLEYWLKQVELKEEKEAARIRTAVSPYLELPKEEPRDTHQATASWIDDSWRHWYVVHYQPRFTIPQSAQSFNATCSRRSRPYIVFNRFFRRLLHTNTHPPTSMLTGVYADVLDHDLLPASGVYDLQTRRVASWPCVQASSHHPCGTVSALQLQRARQSLLQRTSKEIHHI